MYCLVEEEVAKILWFFYHHKFGISGTKAAEKRLWLGVPGHCGIASIAQGL